jgi:hypothetical protein
MTVGIVKRTRRHWCAEVCREKGGEALAFEFFDSPDEAIGWLNEQGVSEIVREDLK